MHLCSGGSRPCSGIAGDHRSFLPASGEGQRAAHSSKVCFRGLGFVCNFPLSATLDNFNQDVAVELMQLCHGQLMCLVAVPSRRCAPETHRSAGTAADAAAPEVMPHKNDLIIWLRMQPLQQRLYEVQAGNGCWSCRQPDVPAAGWCVNCRDLSDNLRLEANVCRHFWRARM